MKNDTDHLEGNRVAMKKAVKATKEALKSKAKKQIVVVYPKGVWKKEFKKQFCTAMKQEGVSTTCKPASKKAASNKATTGKTTVKKNVAKKATTKTAARPVVKAKVSTKPKARGKKKTSKPVEKPAEKKGFFSRFF